jgi:hypothetical protein
MRVIGARSAYPEPTKTARRLEAGSWKKSIVRKRVLADATMYVGLARDVASRKNIPGDAKWLTSSALGMAVLVGAIFPRSTPAGFHKALLLLSRPNGDGGRPEAQLDPGPKKLRKYDRNLSSD